MKNSVSLATTFGSRKIKRCYNCLSHENKILCITFRAAREGAFHLLGLSRCGKTGIHCSNVL